MKKSKFFGALTAAALAALNLTAFAAIPAYADDVDLDGSYHAYLGIQSASYTFRNDWNEATYGQGMEDPFGGYYFDHLTGWDGPTATNNGGTFHDADINGNGTYSVSLDGDFNFGDDETLNLLFISTDIPLNDTVKFTDVKVKIDGNTKYTFDDAYLAEDVTDYIKPQCINIWNDDIKELFGYMMPSSSVELEFTVSGFNYDKAADAAADASSESADGEVYNAYFGIQSASYTFRNDWAEATYGKGMEDPFGGYYFDHLTGWDGPTATNNGGTFHDAEIKGNGTYTVSMDGDFNFGDDETLNLLFVSTDMPLDCGVKVTDVKVKFDGSTKYTFDEAYLAEDVTDYIKPQCINIWNDDIKELFGYMMPANSIELEFTVSGMSYDNTEAAAPEETEAAPEETAAEETEAAAEETEAQIEETQAEETEVAADEAAPAETEAAPAAQNGGSSAAPVIIVIVVVVIAAVVVVVMKKKKA